MTKNPVLFGWPSARNRVKMQGKKLPGEDTKFDFCFAVLKTGFLVSAFSLRIVWPWFENIGVRRLHVALVAEAGLKVTARADLAVGHRRRA